MTETTDTVDMTIMLTAHDALRRDLGHFRRTAASGDFPLVAWNVFTTQLHLHHTSEDEIIWPFLRERLAPLTGDVPVLRQMVEEHALIDPLLGDVEHALAPSDGRRRDRSALADALHPLAVTLESHLDHEERDALPLIATCVSREEWEQVGRRIQRRIGVRGAAEFFPWLLADAAPERERTVLAMLPRLLRLVYEHVSRPRYLRRVGPR